MWAMQVYYALTREAGQLMSVPLVGCNADFMYHVCGCQNYTQDRLFEGIKLSFKLYTRK